MRHILLAARNNFTDVNHAHASREINFSFIYRSCHWNLFLTQFTSENLILLSLMTSQEIKSHSTNKYLPWGKKKLGLHSNKWEQSSHVQAVLLVTMTTRAWCYSCEVGQANQEITPMAERLRPFEEVFEILSPGFDSPARNFQFIRPYWPLLHVYQTQLGCAIVAYCRLVHTSLNSKWFR